MSSWSKSIVVAGVLALSGSAVQGAEPVGGVHVPRAEATDASGDYAAFVRHFDEFVAWRTPVMTADGSPDFSPAAVDLRKSALRAFQRRMDAFSPDAWPRSRRVDFLAARAQMDEHDFLLHVQRPWARDPGFYIDQVLRPAFTSLPLAPDGVDDLRRSLQRIEPLLSAARENLEPGIVPADFARLALFNLSRADGVGHGHPYREVPPAGVLGWYDDLLERAQLQQPDLVPDIRSARAAIDAFRDWLDGRQDTMTAKAGFGEALFDWYLEYVKYMPYTSREIEVLAQRELERTLAFRALELHRNRALPELALPASRDEYEARVAAVDADIRAFLVEEDFITVPTHIPGAWRTLGFNVPWIERPGGPNFWEQVQFRDPSPDHWHAVIPGHRFDAMMLARNTHPVRRHLRDGGRAEGWALYLEEAPLQLGFYDKTGRHRTRELIYDFAIFRAVRTIGDVRLQHNRVSTREVAEYWRKWTPRLDADVARVDAEIYLRRPPGYGLGYTIGSFQLFKLLGERRHQLGDAFVLKDFHDAFMAAGGIPIALTRYEMTGNDDEVRRFIDRPALSSVIAAQARTMTP